LWAAFCGPSAILQAARARFEVAEEITAAAREKIEDEVIKKVVEK
jgi:hypothetical protein